MQMCPTIKKTYEGDLPYVYASYCKDDTERVMPILKVLQNNECRLQYETEESEGTMSLAEASVREPARVILTFISEQSLESHDWRKEFNLSVLEKKSIVAVLLDEVSFTVAMNRQMENVQAISYSECKTNGACCVKLLQNEEIKKCLEEEKTVLIPKYSMKKYYLSRKSNGEQIHIDKTDFTIGRKVVCDYVIPDNVMISRIHAIFELEDGVCSVYDNYSTNKVYVNDRELEPEEKCVLKSGDVVEIGNEKFIVVVIG